MRLVTYYMGLTADCMQWRQGQYNRFKYHSIKNIQTKTQRLKNAMERTEQEKHVGYSQKSNINIIGGSERKERERLEQKKYLKR